MYLFSIPSLCPFLWFYEIFFRFSRILMMSEIFFMILSWVPQHWICIKNMIYCCLTFLCEPIFPPCSLPVFWAFLMLGWAGHAPISQWCLLSALQHAHPNYPGTLTSYLHSLSLLIIYFSFYRRLIPISKWNTIVISLKFKALPWHPSTLQLLSLILLFLSKTHWKNCPYSPSPSLLSTGTSTHTIQTLLLTPLWRPHLSKSIAAPSYQTELALEKFWILTDARFRDRAGQDQYFIYFNPF